MRCGVYLLFAYVTDSRYMGLYQIKVMDPFMDGNMALFRSGEHEAARVTK